ncbi:MAG: penicillin acylase family protein, partial [Chitinophagales bacterium]|nr:penicillin acylase family protein [Chitinophagales bacterium]
INERLEQMKNINEDSMRLLQYDEKNMIAAFLKDTLIAQVDESKLNKNQKQLLQSLRAWNNFATAESANQTLFNAWCINLKSGLWEDEFGGKEMIYPTTDISMRTVKFNINRKWVDNSSTPQVETLNELINHTYTATCDSLEREFGGDPEKWEWAMVKKTHVTHLLRIPAFSNTLVYTGGNSGIVNASGSDHGPSWRMIVELGKEPKAYGLYPGGQSGNPGSPFYDNMIEPWSKGEQKELLILHSAEEKNNHIVSSIVLKK